MEQDRSGVNPGSSSGPDPISDREGSENPTVFIVGLGFTGKNLIGRLVNKVPVVGLDTDEAKLELADREFGGKGVTLVNRDGTSRLAWEDLKLKDLDSVVAVTSRDEVNLEVCRIARDQFGVRRLLAVVHDPRRSEEYARFGIEIVCRAGVLAAAMESRVLRDRRVALNIGLGEGEVIEVPVLHGSPVIGRPLHSFRARPWLVGAIYRKEELLVPHGDTIILEGDRVVLIGEPHVLAGIAEFFKMGEPEFPLQYGPKIGVLASGRKDRNTEWVASEAGYLVQNSRATSLVIVGLLEEQKAELQIYDRIWNPLGLPCERAHWRRGADLPFTRHLLNLDLGCLVMPPQDLGVFRRFGILDSLVVEIIENSRTPVLISRGSHPYRRILVPVAIQSSPLRVAEMAINLARLFRSHLEAVTVTEPRFAAGEALVMEKKKILDRVEELSGFYRLPIRVHHREGNPISEIVQQSSGYDLLVLGHGQGRGRRFFPRLDLALEILARVSCSVMVLPFKKDEEGS